MSYTLTHPTGENWDHAYSILSGHIGPNEPSPDYMARFDEILCDFMREQGVPGAALCISLHGKVIYRQGYGINRAGQPISSSSHFRIASISKVLTAIGIMRLCEEGRIHLDQHVLGSSGILSHIHVSRARQTEIGNITVRHLLEHSGGWDRDLDGDQVFWYQHWPHRFFIDVWNNWSLVMHVLSIALRFKPGTKHAYSNFGYLLLGLVIEKVTKMRYEDFIRDVLRKIGVEDLAIGRTRQQELVDFREVKYYNNKDPPVERSILRRGCRVQPQYGSFPMENTGAYGGWVTSPESLVTVLDSLIMQYDLAHVLSDHSVEQMLQRPRYVLPTATEWYGFGLDVEDGGSSFGHTGAMEGTSTTVHHNKNGLTWCFLMNSWSKDMDLDGLVKFALASIPGLPLWQNIVPGLESTDYFLISSDRQQCVRILLPHSEFEDHLRIMKCEGYIIGHICVLTVGHDVWFTIVWNKSLSLKDWGVLFDLDLSKLEQHLRARRLQHIEVLFLEPYRLDKQVMHVCVYRPSRLTTQKIYCIKDTDEHEKAVEFLCNQGYELRSESFLYFLHNKVSITAVFDKANRNTKPLKQQRWCSLPIENFVEQLAQSTTDKYRLEYIKFCPTPETPVVQAVLSQCRPQSDKLYGACRHKSCFMNVYQRHDVSKYGFLFELRKTMKTNRRVLFVSPYETEGVIYYATIWSAVTVGKKVKKSKVRGGHKKLDSCVSATDRPKVVIENLEGFEFHNMRNIHEISQDEEQCKVSSEQNDENSEANLESLNIMVVKVEHSDDAESSELVSVKQEAMSDSDSESSGESPDGMEEGRCDSGVDMVKVENVKGCVQVKLENMDEDGLYGVCIENWNQL